MSDNLFDSNKPAEHMGADLEYVFRQLCDAREIIASIILEYEKQRKINYGTMQKAKELLNKGVFSAS
ncbi:hypothetical protein [Methanobrevibacter sp.]|uniref:hypothetical protein n=1 Tax=Methanobrevibacter sp. TaxID=66852 RepID=UPI00386360F7